MTSPMIASRTIEANIRGIWKLYWALMIRNPSPFLAPIISAATSSSSAMVALSRKPTKMAGVAAGRTTRLNTCPFVAPNTRAISIRRLSTSFTPEIVFKQDRKEGGPADDRDLRDLAEPQQKNEDRVDRQRRGLTEQLQQGVDDLLETSERPHEQPERDRHRHRDAERASRPVEADQHVAEQRAVEEPVHQRDDHTVNGGMTDESTSPARDSSSQARTNSRTAP